VGRICGKGRFWALCCVCCVVLARCFISISASLLKCVQPLPPLGHIWDVMLVWKNETIPAELSLCYRCSILYHGTQWYRYKQFLQVGGLDRVLIWLALVVYLPSASISSVFMTLYIFNNFVWYSLLYVSVCSAWWDWFLPGWLTIVRQCCDTVGWVV